MRIGIFSDTYCPQVNGVVTVVRNLKRELEKRGHTVFIFTVAFPDAEEEENVIRLASIKFLNEPQHRISFFLEGQIVKKAAELKLDVIHSNTEFSLFLAARAVSRRLGIPWVHTMHTYYEDYLYYVPLIEPILKTQLPRLLRSIYKKIDCIIAPSVKISKYLEDCGIQPPITLVPNGIDLSIFYEDTRQKAEEAVSFRSRFNLPQDSKIIVFVGRLAEEKNVETLLRNFAEIAKRVPECRLLIVGDGPDRRALQDFAYELGIAEKTIFTGYLSWPREIKTVYDAATMFMSASHSEVHPITFIESMASGLPIVAAADISIANMIVEGENGWTSEDDKLLWQKAVPILQDDKLAEAMGKKAKELSRRYSVERFCESMIDAYSKVIKKHQPGNQKN